jgi:hypothetical protein
VEGRQSADAVVAIVLRNRADMPPVVAPSHGLSKRPMRPKNAKKKRVARAGLTRFRLSGQPVLWRDDLI